MSARYASLHAGLLARKGEASPALPSPAGPVSYTDQPQRRDADLPRAAACLARALAPGGLALVEPWVRPDGFTPGRPQLVVVDTPWLKVCRQVLPRREGDLAVLDFHHLVSGPGLPPTLVRSTDRLHLRPDATLFAALEGAGLRRLGGLPGTMPDREISLWRRA